MQARRQGGSRSLGWDGGGSSGGSGIRAQNRQGLANRSHRGATAALLHQTVDQSLVSGSQIIELESMEHDGWDGHLRICERGDVLLASPDFEAQHHVSLHPQGGLTIVHSRVLCCCSITQQSDALIADV